jgi:hypothetical protein
MTASPALFCFLSCPPFHPSHRSNLGRILTFMDPSSPLSASFCLEYIIVSERLYQATISKWGSPSQPVVKATKNAHCEGPGQAISDCWQLVHCWSSNLIFGLGKKISFMANYKMHPVLSDWVIDDCLLNVVWKIKAVFKVEGAKLSVPEDQLLILILQSSNRTAEWVCV